MSTAPQQVPTLPPLRYSVLRQMSRSPAHARYALENEIPSTPAMRLGRLAHAVMLGTPLPYVWPGERRGKAWIEFRDAHEGEDIVKQDELDTASCVALCLDAHPEARRLLTGIREQTVRFDFAGRPCRATPDVLGAHWITELKTTSDAGPARFPWTALRLGYHGQLAWQKDAVLAAGAGKPEELWIVAIEVKEPYAVAVYELTERAEEFGRRQYRAYLEEFLVCEASGEWPGYPMGTLDAPEESAELIGLDGEAIEVSD